MGCYPGSHLADRHDDVRDPGRRPGGRRRSGRLVGFGQRQPAILPDRGQAEGAVPVHTGEHDAHRTLATLVRERDHECIDPARRTVLARLETEAAGGNSHDAFRVAEADPARQKLQTVGGQDDFTPARFRKSLP